MKRREDFLRVILSGGLGNQLFQFFAAIKIYKQLDVDFLHYSRTFFKTSNEIRDFELAGVVDFKKASFLIDDSRFFDRVYFKIANRVADDIASLFGCWPGKKALNHIERKSLTLAGYFQDLDYLPSRDEVRSFFIDESNVQQDTIAIHLRRGDYLKANNSHYGVVSLTDALSVLRVIDTGSSEIMVFSDSDVREELAANMHASELARTTMASDLCSGSISEFLLMRSCRKIICSNSTFSWWAAFSGMPEHIYLPSMWKRDEPTESKLIFDGVSIYETTLV